MYTTAIGHLNSHDVEAAKVPVIRWLGTEGGVHVRIGTSYHLQEPGGSEGVLC